MVTYLFLRHDDCNTFGVKLWPAGPANHLQTGAAIILFVPSSFASVTTPPAGTLEHHQMSWQVDTHCQGGCCAEYLQSARSNQADASVTKAFERLESLPWQCNISSQLLLGTRATPCLCQKLAPRICELVLFLGCCAA